MLLLVLLLLVLIVGWLTLESVLVGWCCSNLCCSMLNGQVGKCQACNAVLMWSSSWCNVCWLSDTILAPCAKVLYTLCLAPSLCLLSQWRYWYVCVLVSCRLQWWVCCRDQVKLECQGIVVIPVGWVLLLWTVYGGPVCWCALEKMYCVLP